MSKVIKYLTLSLVVLFVSGCTHKISMSPNDNVFIESKSDELKNYNVAYFIDKNKQNLTVVSPGGGGDKIEYKPYEDTEYVFRNILSNVFKKVYKLDSLSNINFIKDNDIKYVFTYNLKTDSYSTSAFTWPPTNFKIDLEAFATNNEGNLIWKEVVKDEAIASYTEFKNDFSLSARRASKKVFKKLYYKLKDSDSFKKEY